jgi:hypothetical protein
MTAKTVKTAKPAPEKPMQPLKEFMANINKKDKLNGLKITFGFSKRKRK